MFAMTKKMSRIPFEGGIREVLAAAEKMEREGRKIVHFEIGRPDFDSPMEAKKAAAEAVLGEYVHYSPIPGLRELREEIASWESHRRGIRFDPEEQIIITCGAVEALIISFVALTDPGDEILILTPCFPAYRDQAVLACAVPVLVPVRLGQHYEIDFEALENAVTPRTKMLILNSPNNPTGAAVEGKDLDRLCEFIVRHDLIAISDECYGEFLYEGASESILSRPAMAERTILVNALSKSFSMTGWRIGYAIAPRQYYSYLCKTHQLFTTSTCTFSQKGAIEALKSGASLTERMIADFRNRRNSVMRALDRCKGITYNRPVGAFYVFPSIEKMNVSAFEFCRFMLEEEGIALVPGDAFGLERHVRIAYTCPEKDVVEGMERFVHGCRTLSMR